MVKGEYVIKQVPRNLDRALTAIATEANQFQCEITVNIDAKRYSPSILFVSNQLIEKNGKSSMALRSLEYKKGSKIYVEVRGRDEKAALEAYMKALETYL